MDTLGLELSDRNRGLLAAVYPLLLVSAVTPVVEVISSSWPMHLDQIPWRVGAVGILTTASLSTAVALGLIVMVASILGHRIAVRAVGAIAAALAIVVTLSAAMFFFDALQMRRAVPITTRRTFDANVVKSLLLAAALVPALLWLALRCIVGTRVEATSAADKGAGLVVGQS